MECDTSSVVERYLDLWADWMRSWSASSELGYPSQSLKMCVAGGVASEDTFDHMCEAADNIAARSMDSIIESLSNIHKAAIYQYKLASVFRFRDYEQSLEEAISEIESKMARKSLV